MIERTAMEEILLIGVIALGVVWWLFADTVC